MRYKIILDSCGDLTEDLKKDKRIQTIPLELQIGDYIIKDDETFNQKDFLKRIAQSQECPKSACPSPEIYMNAYDCEAEDIYVITLSSNLSGSHNSACLGKKLYHEKKGEKNIHVFDSCSASIGQTRIALKIMELAEAGKAFDEIARMAQTFKEEQNTYFILDNLETLRKNGRLSKTKVVVAATLKIKPIMGSTKEGTITQLGQSLGMKKALQKMADIVLANTKDIANKNIMISHCNCRERAECFKQIIMDRIETREIEIVDTAGISSMYANDGGIIIAV